MLRADNEKRQKTPSASCAARAAFSSFAAESSVVIHQSDKIGRKDRWMRDDEGGLGMYHACSTGDSLTDDVSKGRSSELGSRP